MKLVFDLSRHPHLLRRARLHDQRCPSGSTSPRIMDTEFKVVLGAKADETEFGVALPRTERARSLTARIHPGTMA